MALNPEWVRTVVVEKYIRLEGKGLYTFYYYRHDTQRAIGRHLFQYDWIEAQGFTLDGFIKFLRDLGGAEVH